MKRFRVLLITALIVAMGTVSAFADIVSVQRMLYRAKWYIILAVVIIIIAIVLLRAAIRKRSRKTEEELQYRRLENGEALQPARSMQDDLRADGSDPEPRGEESRDQKEIQ